MLDNVDRATQDRESTKSCCVVGVYWQWKGEETLDTVYCNMLRKLTFLVWFQWGSTFVSQMGCSVVAPLDGAIETIAVAYGHQCILLRYYPLDLVSMTTIFIAIEITCMYTIFELSIACMC